MNRTNKIQTIKKIFLNPKIYCTHFVLIVFLFSCVQRNESIKTDFFFAKNDDVLPLYGNWKITTNPDYNPITNEPKDDFYVGYIPRMWFNSNIKNKYIVTYNTYIEISDTIIKDKFGLLVFNVINSNEVYINGILIGKRGIINKDKTKIKNNARPSMYSIPENILHKGKNRITLRVADDAASGGLLEELRLCKINTCEKIFNQFLLLTGATGFFLIFIAVYHIFLFLGNRKDNTILYFGLGTFFHGLTFLGFERILYFFSDSFLLHFYVMNLSYSLSAIFAVIFIHSFLEVKIDRISSFLLLMFTLALISTIFAGFSLEYRSFHSRYVLLINVMGFVPVLAIQVMHLTIRAYKRNQVGSSLILFGFIILMLTTLLVPLHLLHIIPTKPFTMEGSLILITSVTFALSLKSRETGEKLLALEKGYRIELEKEVKLKTEAIEKNNFELIKSNSMKDKLFSIIAHDLRNPLFALEEVIYLFQEKHLTLNSLQKNMISLSETLENNRFLLENLLQWSYIQLGFSPLQLETIDFNKLLFESIQLHKSFFEKKKITIIVQDKNTMFCKADDGIIRLILRNLISNAIKFTKKGGRIEIFYGNKNDSYFFSVKDNGIGIPKKKQKDFFLKSSVEKNSQGTEGERGSGIGLSLCKDFAERMNGEISFKSKEGEGSIFTMTWKTNES